MHYCTVTVQLKIYHYTQFLHIYKQRTQLDDVTHNYQSMNMNIICNKLKLRTMTMIISCVKVLTQHYNSHSYSTQY